MDGKGLGKLVCLTLGNEIIIPLHRRTVPIKTTIWTTYVCISICNLFLLEDEGKILEMLYLLKMQVYSIKRSKAAEMLNLIRRKWYLKSGLALLSGCACAGFTFLSSGLV